MGSKKSSCNNALIVLEGLPCSGKTTIARRLAKDLSAVLISESSPGTQVKNLERINFYLNDLRKGQNSHNGSVFIVDRYFLSTIAFEEVLKSLIERKLLGSHISTLYDLKRCCGRRFYGLLIGHRILAKPDLVFHLKISADVSIKRQRKVEKNVFKYNIWRNKKFLSEFQNFCLRNSKKYYKADPIIIDANLPLNEIYIIILKRLKRFIKLKNEPEGP